MLIDNPFKWAILFFYFFIFKCLKIQIRCFYYGLTMHLAISMLRKKTVTANLTSVSVTASDRTYTYILIWIFGSSPFITASTLNNLNVLDIFCPPKSVYLDVVGDPGCKREFLLCYFLLMSFLYRRRNRSGGDKWKCRFFWPTVYVLSLGHICHIFPRLVVVGLCGVGEFL